MPLSVVNCTALLQHLVAATLAPERGVPANELLTDLKSGDDLRDGPAALDSLDQLSVARQVAEFFELEKTGAEELLLRRNRLTQWSELITGSLNTGTLTELWFRSGGTTGEPKLIAQPLSHLVSEVREINRIVGDAKRIIALVPLHHIYGFIWGPLLSDQLDAPLIHGEAAIEAAHHGLQAGDLVLGIPEWWQYLGRSRTPVPAGVTGVTSTAPCPPGVIRAALEKGLQSMIEVYGSSDTGGIAWRDSPDAGFRLFDHWSRHDDDHLQSETGRVCPLPDLVDWETDRTLIPRRRRDNAIQVGGVNVWPDRVRGFIENHPRVQACAVRPMDTAQGIRLKAFVVPSDGARDEIRSELLRWLKANLSAAERPVQLTLGDKLPRNPMGKLCDW
ncbi:MAG: AMP-binding protein [Marinobacter sp.]